ncbi:Rha family transcriptional regulator [Comamonas sp. NoAH]|uniref:Rha family transcriptional regulator n=1 Tax=Comamonas halotolerans TaxID=3041496 RepID=UPI0024E054B5|nr:Rha family transcriptional regulator [Comamonas sp. NoAH]
MSKTASVITPAITIVDGKPTTLSTDLARHFSKRHDDVLRTIRNLLPQLSEEHLRNFAEASVEVESGNGAKASYPAYRLTRDGFTLLAMGFTGKKALAFKLAYIDAFNRMEAELQKLAYDPDQIALAHRTAVAATAEVYQSVFDAVLQGNDWRHNRYMLGFDANPETTAVACVKPIESNAYVLPMERFHSAIEDSICIDAQTLTQLASTCTARLGRMAARNAVAAPQQGSLQLR